jgi:hypothetical protein
MPCKKGARENSRRVARNSLKFHCANADAPVARFIVAFGISLVNRRSVARVQHAHRRETLPR